MLTENHRNLEEAIWDLKEYVRVMIRTVNQLEYETISLPEIRSMVLALPHKIKELEKFVDEND